MSIYNLITLFNYNMNINMQVFRNILNLILSSKTIFIENQNIPRGQRIYFTLNK